MPRPLITIITVVYNANSTLEVAIRSVLNQKKELFEYWIIDGGSTDGSIDTIKKYEQQLGGWVSERDKGIFDAMNKGVARAKGEWIYFLGADDTLQPDALMKISSHLGNPYKVVYGDVLFDNNHLMRSFLSIGTLIQNTLHHQGAFYYRSLFNNFQYDQSLPIQADYELNLLIYIQHLPAKYVSILISTYALGGNSVGHTEKSLKEINKIRARHLKSRWQNAFFSLLTRLYFSQKQFRFWLYGHRV